MSNARGRRKPRAVVFDMDGLLVDSERLTREVWQTSTKESGFALTDEVYLTLIGLGPAEAERVLHARFGPEFDVPAFTRRRVQRMQELLESRGLPYKRGARELLAWLFSLELPLSLATSSTRDEVQERLPEVASLFTTITTRADVARGKPSPDIYLAAAASLDLAPGECLALEDSFAGVRAASAAGMPVLMVPDLAAPTPEVAALTAGVFESLDDVRAALASWWTAGNP